jgi:UDP-N-acetylmuramoyl-tripeptide--D-alanyl-D-alanine ligase
MITAAQLAEILEAPPPLGDPTARANGGVSTDTRTLPKGCAFFALTGAKFDANTLAPQALQNGASIAIVSRWDGGEPPPGTAVVIVCDTLLALQRLAHWWRRQLDIPVVCITGSNGKTSTKDFTAAVLAEKFNVSCTKGNLNNHIGLPLTVLATRPDHSAAVWEIGMNHAGELAPLCEIAKPRYGIITNIGTAHIEFLGTRQAIAEEKGTLARYLPADGTLFVPASCDFFDYFRQRTRAHIIAVGNGRGSVRAEEPVLTPLGTRFTLVIDGHGTATVDLKVPGKHMINNALLAAAVGFKLGIPIENIARGLSNAGLTNGRVRRFDHHGITLIDDSYNANPESMTAALETLTDTPVVNGGRRIAVLGRMGELGEHAATAHREIGHKAFAAGHTVVTVGNGAELIAEAADSPLHFPSHEDAAAWLQAHARPGDAILFKGSRSAAIERVLHTAFPNH